MLSAKGAAGYRPRLLFLALALTFILFLFEFDPVLLALLAYYKDNKAKEKADSDLSGNAKIRFLTAKNGMPPVVGRDTVTSTLYVRNEHRHGMQLKPITPDPDLTIIEYPAFLEPDQIGRITLQFKPAADRIDPLSAGWDFEKIVYAKEDQPQ